MPKQISARKVIWVSVMLVMAMAMPALPSQAQFGTEAISDVSCAPDSGTAHITGKVTGNGGVALNNVQVAAYTLWGERAGGANTNASGVYTITNLIGSNYLIQFNPQFNPGPYVAEWHGDQQSPFNATPVLVNTGATITINNQLPAGAQIRGTVQGAGAGPLQSVQVSVLDASGNQVAGAFTVANGTYTTTPGLAAGAHRVEFKGVSGFLGQVYNGKSSLDTADSVMVAGAGFINNINATLARGGAITGKVTRAGGGTPVTSAEVSAFSNTGFAFGFTNGSGDFVLQGLPSGVYEMEVTADNLIKARQTVTVTVPNTVTANVALAAGGVITGRVTDASNNPLNGITVYISNQDGSYQEYVSTNASGIYNATGMASGAYTVFFRPDDWIPEIYDNKPFESSQANVVNVTAPFTVTNINASLDKGATISGTVTDAITGLPIKNVFVEVLGTDAQRIESAFTDANGRYRMKATVPTGSYKLRFNADERFASCAYVAEYNNDKFTLESADPIAITAPNIHVINAGLSRGSIIFGRVTDALTGAPVTQGNIRIYDSAGKTAMFGRLTFLGGYRTQTALPSGAYRAEFVDGDAGGYIDEFWDDKPSLASANAINLNAPNDAGNLNFAVVKGGTISGKVTASDTGLPFSQGFIQVYDAAGGRAGEASIDPDGTYRVKTGLSAGSYRVAVIPFGFDNVMAVSQQAPLSAPKEEKEEKSAVVEMGEAAPAEMIETTEISPEALPTDAAIAEPAPPEPMQPTRMQPARIASAGTGYLPTFFGGTVIVGPANVAVTVPGNTANIDIVIKHGVLIPSVQR